MAKKPSIVTKEEADSYIFPGQKRTNLLKTNGIVATIRAGQLRKPVRFENPPPIGIRQANKLKGLSVFVWIYPNSN